MAEKITAMTTMYYKNTNYASREYWNRRYDAEKEPFEWFQRYGGIKNILYQQIKKTDKILIVGCGNSRVAEKLERDGYQDIHCIDFSDVVIEQMKEKYKNSNHVQYIQMDATSLKYGDAYFDVVIDKATLDSLLCADGASRIISMVVKEVFRVLKPSGKFLMLSYAKGSARVNYLNRPELTWKITIEEVAKPSIGVLPMDEDSVSHYFYICVKEMPKDIITTTTSNSASEVLSPIPSGSQAPPLLSEQGKSSRLLSVPASLISKYKNQQQQQQEHS